MKRSNAIWMSACALALGVLVLPAGAQQHDHAHSHAGHSHTHKTEKDFVLPKDYDSAIVRLKECLTVIAEEFSAGHVDEVHPPLDEANVIVNKLLVLARDSGVPKSQWQDINLAVKDLKKQLGSLHVAVETKRSFDFKAASTIIAKAVRRLELVAAAPAAATTR